jgi:hypothetical protein
LKILPQITLDYIHESNALRLSFAAISQAEKKNHGAAGTFLDFPIFPDYKRAGRLKHILTNTDHAEIFTTDIFELYQLQY